MRFFGSLILLALIAVACHSDRVYEYNKEFKERAWKSSDTAFFEFAIRDLGKKYNVYYNIRNSLDYPYARLFVQYSLKDSTGVRLQKKLVSEFLFDQKTGRPRGNSGLGDVYDHQFMLLKGYEFKKRGLYKLNLEQFMRTDTLKGILAVGVRVEKTAEKE